MLLPSIIFFSNFSFDKQIFILNIIGLKTITNDFGSFTKGDERKVINIKYGSLQNLKFLY